jgi:hypothetical protein
VPQSLQLFPPCVDLTAHPGPRTNEAAAIHMLKSARFAFQVDSNLLLVLRDDSRILEGVCW